MENGMLKRSPELKKHVAAIHSSNHLTLLQRKIANALLYNAYGSLLEKDEHQIHISALCNLVGYDSKDFKLVKKSLVSLMSTVVEWNLVDTERFEGKGDGIWNASSIIADACIEGPICKYSYSNRMKQLLYRPELYGRLNMEVQARFKSAYGLALYENSIRYRNINQTPWFKMETFRKLMGVVDGRYLIFRDFKRRVIDPAILEVNEYSPICVQVQLKKENQFVVALQFLITPKEGQQRTLSFSSHNQEINQILEKRYGLSSTQIKKITSDYREDYIYEKIKIIEASKNFKTGKIDNLAMYLESALKNDYQLPKSSKEYFNSEIEKKEEQKKLEKEKQIKFDEYRKFVNKQIIELFNNFDEKTKKPFIKEFESYIKGEIYSAIYAKQGLYSPLVIDRFCDFVRTNKKELLQDILSFEHFLNPI